MLKKAERFAIFVLIFIKKNKVPISIKTISHSYYVFIVSERVKFYVIKATEVCDMYIC